MKPARTKKTIITLIKFGLSAALIGYLVIDASRDETFANLVDQPKHWGMLAAAWALCTLATMLTMVRWYFLVRALDLPFKMSDALRLGFLGYLFNFVSLGSVGGDLFKAVFLAREQKGRRAEAVASVIADRLIGLYALFVVASAAILLFGQMDSPSEVVQKISDMTLIATGIGTCCFALMFTPGDGNWYRKFLFHLPKVGNLFRKLFAAIDAYRRKPGVLLGSLLMSFGVHSCSSVGFYLIAHGVSNPAPDMGDHFVIVPLALVTGVLPLPANGLGALENVVALLYGAIPSAALQLHKGQALVVAIVYRLITILIAMVGAVFYLGYRREVTELMKKAEEERLGGGLQAASAYEAGS